ncbi:unnamed protein product [Adineta steineri]|uniref:G-protein coupled receptors family 1 profile domain-containing protein n=1 Tax=Adineta steineri TaxID=433720 RepID=A0A819XN55_9BILA|nr:unnamed protein product [Adineta steineri]CAF4144479.1 unnamed protein product [Adineta steineri]
MAVTILPLIQTQITRYGMSTLLILGNIGNVIIIILFYRRRQNSCAMYLLCAAIVQSAALTFNTVLNLYALDYDDPTVHSLFLCKFRAYITHIWNQLGRYLTVLASILVTIHNERCGSFGVYYVIYQVYTATFLGLLPPVLMSIFGFLAYHNMKKLHLRVRPIGNLGYDSIIIHRRDRDLLLMVLTEVVIYVVTAIPYPFIVLEVAVTNYIGVSKSTQRVEIENFLNSTALTLFSVTYGSRFYTYFVVSKAFRKDCKTLFIKWKNHVLGRSTINQIPRARQLQI